MEKPEPIPEGTQVRLQSDGRVGYVYTVGGGRFELAGGRWVGDYRYVFCAEKQTGDCDSLRPPEGCF